MTVSITANNRLFTRRTPHIAWIIVLFAVGQSAGCGGNAAPAATQAAVSVAATPSPLVETAAATAKVQSTLPPSWTPAPSLTSAFVPTGTPLAAPPAGLTGHLMVLSGEQITDDRFLPLVIMNPDGSNAQLLATDPNRGEYAILLPDGKHIIYTYLAGGTGSVLMRSINLNVSGAQEVSRVWGSAPPLAQMRMASVSSDGKLLAFAAQNILANEQYSAVYVVKLSTLYTAPDTPTVPATTKPPVPTKAGTRIANAPPTAVQGSLITPTITATPSLAEQYLTRVTPLNIGENNWPAISPDGKSVVFVTDTSKVGKDGIDLYLAPVAANSKPINLTNDAGAFTEGAPAWSPDSKQIAFMASAPNSQNNDIFLINADGSNRRTLVHIDNTNNFRPHWSLDGKYIGFTSDRSGKSEVYIIDISSGMTYQVTHNDVVNILSDWSKQ